MKLARRLTLVLALGVCTVFAVDTALHLRRIAALYEADVRRDQGVLARVIAPAFETEWRTRGEAAALALLGDVHRFGNEARVRLVRLDAPDGGPFAPDVDGARSHAVATDLVHRQFMRETPDGDRFYTYAPLSLADGSAAALEISEPLAGERRFVESRLWGSLVSAGVVALVCGLFAWFAGTRLVGRPFRALIDKARRTAAGDFSGPIPETGHDELAELACEMNAMAGQLARSGRRLADEAAARVAALEQLRHADRLTTIGTLAAGLAHELGTPLAIVAGQARRIATGDVDGAPETAELGQIVLEQADRMTRIVRGLLDFSRRGSSDKHELDVATCVRQTVALLGPLARRSGVSIACDLPAEPIRARIDPARLQQALANLVVNAVQVSAEGGVVRTRLERVAALPPSRAGGVAQACLAIDVTDAGPGLTPDIAAKVFDPFFTTKPVGSGTGLGLSVAQGIVAEHGGWIELESTPGQGSRFGVRIPLEDTNTPEGEMDGEATARDQAGLHAALG